MSDLTLTLQLLGPGPLLNDPLLTWEGSRRAGCLLVVLVLQPEHRASRDDIREALWPDYPDPKGPNGYVSAAIWQLRTLLGEIHLPKPKRGYPLQLLLNRLEVDLLGFERDSSATDPDSLARAVARYKGPLLETWKLDQLFGSAMAAVIRKRRDVCEQKFLRACETLARHSWVYEGTDAAVRRLLAAVDVAPFREASQRAQLQHHAERRDYLALIDAYAEICRPAPSDTRDIARERHTLVAWLRDAARSRASQQNGGTVQPQAPDVSRAAPKMTRVPYPLTPLIGRSHELETLRPRLGSTRLMTLHGIGGIGKTRLATALAHVVTAADPEGVGFVDLAPLTQPDLLPATVAAALGVTERDSGDGTGALVVFIHPRPFLLVLDNCEHLLNACSALIVSLLSACPWLRVLATSRRLLGVPGELAWPVPPLPVPEEGFPLDAACPSVELFVARAIQNRPDFALSHTNAAHVTAICRHLDGIPLAIELAAARLKILSLEQIERDLDDRFHLLTSTVEGTRPEHRSLRTALAWSVDQLSDSASLLFRRMSIFAGCTRAAASAAQGETPPPDPGPSLVTGGVVSVLDVLDELADSSLVTVENNGEEARYRMLETVRAFAAERLRDAGERDVARDLHLSFFTRLGEDAERQMKGTERGQGVARLAPERDNLRAALSWAMESGSDPTRTKLGLMLASALGRFWELQGSMSEGRQWLAGLLSRSNEVSDGDEARRRVKALHGAARLADTAGRRDCAMNYCEEALDLCREYGSSSEIAAALRTLVWHGVSSDRWTEERVLLQEAANLHRECHDREGLALTLFLLGKRQSDAGDHEQARRSLTECLAIRREIGDEAGAASALRYLAVLFWIRDSDTARDYLCKSLEICQRAHHMDGAAHSLLQLGRLAQQRGELDRALAHFDAMREIAETSGDRPLTTRALGCMGAVARDQGNLDHARRIFEEVAARARQIGDHRQAARHLYRCSLCERDEGASDALRADAIAEFLQEEGTIIPEFLDHANIALAAGDTSRAVRLLGAAFAVRDALVAEPAIVPPAADEECPIQRRLEEARAMLEEDAFDAALAEGRALSVENAVLELLSEE